MTAGKARAGTAKIVLAAGAVGAFAVCAMLARGSHAAAGSTPATQGLQTPQSLLSALQQDTSSDDSFGDSFGGGGQVQGTTEAPQVQSSTS